MVYILGRGVPPPNNYMLRLSAGQIKITPMENALRDRLDRRVCRMWESLRHWAPQVEFADSLRWFCTRVQSVKAVQHALWPPRERKSKPAHADLFIAEAVFN
jgi:hypothetical protein